ncbi:hypothetical protein [Sagittula marina]|uniref:hypothetical protein n=1 Tax=Sagittula marina TaxID=943940 RepID=UPI0031CE0C42
MRRGDVVVFRYQNNVPRLVPTLVMASLVILTALKARLMDVSLVWICHNVDQDTLPYFKPIERLRRAALMRLAHAVLVLDPAFLPYMPRRDARAVSFGAKRDGSVSAENMVAIRAFADRFDRVVLIAGQDKGKYKAFARIPEVVARFAEAGLEAGVITAGMAGDRVFDPATEGRVLRIVEKNIRESALAGQVDFIYRENADISMPYTVYAAATASIPVLTRRGNILADILEREGIGLCLDGDITQPRQAYDFSGFLKRHSWDSLSRILTEQGIEV